jgi:hypothetical protein
MAQGNDDAEVTTGADGSGERLMMLLLRPRINSTTRTVHSKLSTRLLARGRRKSRQRQIEEGKLRQLHTSVAQMHDVKYANCLMTV